jgi:hypothetical protein
MAPTTAAGTTVIGDGADVAGRINYDFESNPKSGRIYSKGKGHVANDVEPVKFHEQASYLEEGNRPFFVIIGKGGVIEALQKLDRQLQNVCSFSKPALSQADALPLRPTSTVFYPRRNLLTGLEKKSILARLA